MVGTNSDILQKSDISIKGETGGEFEAYLVKPSEGAPGILLFAGAEATADAQRTFADTMAADGYVVLAPDFVHNLADARAALLSLNSLTVKGAGIGMVGLGLGGGLAFSAAALGADALVLYYPEGLDDRLPQADRIGCPVVIHQTGEGGGLDALAARDN